MGERPQQVQQQLEIGRVAVRVDEESAEYLQVSDRRCLAGSRARRLGAPALQQRAPSCLCASTAAAPCILPAGCPARCRILLPTTPLPAAIHLPPASHAPTVLGG